jgi:hypothetical protein
MTKVPCSINEGKKCDEPFCRWHHYALLSHQAYEEFICACRKELFEAKEREILNKLVIEKKEV